MLNLSNEYHISKGALFQRLILIIGLCLFLVISSPAGNLLKVRKFLEKAQYDKAEKVVRKALDKNPEDIEGNFYLSILFLEASYNLYNIDSALIFINKADTNFSSANEEALKDLSKSLINKELLKAQRDSIDEAGYRRAMDAMNVESMEYFTKTFDGATQAEKVLQVRDSLVYDKAKITNTWQTYEAYFQTYPASVYADEAKKKYQSLIFQSYTSDGGVNGYILFLEDHPTTPFRKQAESVIFDLLTPGNDWNGLKNFLQRYPDSYLAKRAGDIMYHQSKNRDTDDLKWVLASHPLSDSLVRVNQLEEAVILPFFAQGKFGFMDMAGNLVLPLVYSGVDENYICETSSEIWLSVLLDNIPQIINRAGEAVLAGQNDFIPINSTAYLVGKDRRFIYHASGHLLSDISVQDAKAISNSWIAFRQDYNWGILDARGDVILDPKYEAIEQFGSLIVVELNGKLGFIKPNSKESLAKVALLYDDYEFISDSLLLVYDGENEGLFDLNLEILVPLDTHEIQIASGLITVKDSNGYQLLNVHNQSFGPFRDIILGDTWTGLKSDSIWSLCSSYDFDSTFQGGIDSLCFFGSHFIFALRGKESWIILDDGKKFNLEPKENVELVAKNGRSINSNYLQITSSKNKGVLDSNGNKIFETEGELSLLADSVFGIKKNGKMGLLSTDGSTLVPVKYDVVDEAEHLVFLLQSGKIGAFDLTNYKLIPAEYNERIERFGSEKYLVREADGYALIDSSNERLLPGLYDDITYWNDSTLWVKKGASWSLIQYDGRELISNVVSVRSWLQVKDEAIVIIFGEGGHGLVSDRRGMILPMQYNDILNVGTNDAPIFFAEQHLETAGLFIVTYFNFDGVAFKSQAYRPDEYDRIYCDQ
jgi:tetratricopeptide (TPR) repeat protein